MNILFPIGLESFVGEPLTISLFTITVNVKEEKYSPPRELQLKNWINILFYVYHSLNMTYCVVNFHL